MSTLPMPQLGHGSLYLFYLTITEAAAAKQSYIRVVGVRHQVRGVRLSQLESMSVDIPVG